MEQDTISFSVQMTVKDVYRFNMYHVYHSASGLVGLLLSLLALCNLIISFDSLTDQGKTIMTIVAMWFTVLEPIMVYSRAKKQVKKITSYHKPLHYKIDEQGITVSQDEESQTMEWNRLRRIVKTRQQILVYSSRVHAFIFPRVAWQDQEKKIQNLLKKYAADNGIWMNRSMKRS
ncbi:MAG TPA: hypothetical protein DHV96_01915 [Lachnospiraceae bacterium]|nr:hypothetical protein [Lachnospiraceae bacterium]